MPAILIPNGKQAFVTPAGVPAVGYKVATFAAGTVNPQTTWADALKVAANTNPVILDARGEAAIFWDGVYKVQLQDPTGTPIWTIDNINASPTGAASLIPTVDNAFFLGSAAFSWANLYLGANHTPVLDVASGIIGSIPRTTLEIAAVVTPISLAYPPGHPLRYGAVGDGVTDDSVALTNALKTGHRILGGGPQYTYLYTVNLTIPATVSNILADWQGATLKPSGVNAPLIGNINAPAVATTALTVAPLIGAVNVTVTSAAGLLVGQIASISAPNYPTYWAKIRVIAGTSITLDTAAPVTYTGVVTTLTAYTASTFPNRIDWQNFRFDGSGLTVPSATLGQCMRWVTAKVVNLTNGEYLNFSLASAASTVVLCETFLCLQVSITNQWTHDNPLGTPAASGSAVMIEADDCGQVAVSNCIMEGDEFGINISRCGQARASGNVMRGQRFYEAQTSGALACVRGIKISSCAVAKWIDNVIEDFITPIKGDLGFQVIIIGNVLRNVPGSGTTGTLYTDSAIEIQPATDTNSYGILIQGNVIENVNGHGIGLSDNNGSATAKLQALIIGNRIKGTKGYAINFIGKDVAIIGNHIEDWDLAAVGTAALGNSIGGLGNGVTIRDNLYIHNSDPTRPLCQGTGANVGSINLIDGNRSPTGNPQLGTSANGFQAQGTGTVLTGTTSIAIVFANPLFRAPAAGEIVITPTGQSSNPPGQWTIGAISNTGFTLTVAANPGAAGFPFGYQARITQPYTV